MPNGMKSGSGEDPFEDVETGGDDHDDRDRRDESDHEPDSVLDEDSADNGSSTTTIPWRYSRKNVKSGRDMVQFYLQDETTVLEDDAVDELEAMLGEEVLTFDVREAAYLVALQEHLDDVADQLREWGYDAE